ncbi:ribose transport system substrate-binding protein [Treponema rectale]|nr:sugar ABC transporter substrate-binding protein [Treponema rectale]MBB5217788.1 ribose transport system substrate-binding protein [Treponema rectale]
MKRIFLLLTVCIIQTLAVSCKKQNALIASICFDSNIEWFQEGIQGMEDASSENHIKFISYNSYYDTGMEFQLAEKLVKSHIKAVIISPIDYTKSVPAIDFLKKHGVKVVTWNTFVNYPVDSEVIVNSQKLGEITGTYLKEYVNEHKLSEVKAAFITNNSYTIAKERCNGFKSAVQSLVDSKKIIVKAEINSELTEETKRNVRTLLNDHPDIQLIWCWNQTTLSACLQTLKEMERTDILICGTDLTKSIALEMLRPNSKVLAVSVQNPYLMGYTALENALNTIKGKDVERIVEIPVNLYTSQDLDALEEYIAR